MSYTTEMRYFSGVEGRAVPRHGSDTFIGCRRVKDIGFVWDLDKVVAIPAVEFVRYGRDYANNLKRGDLKKRSAGDYDAYQARMELEVTAAAEKLNPKKKKRGGKKSSSSSDQDRNNEEEG